MSIHPYLVLTGLLVLSFIGSMLVGGRALRGFGLPSGTEFVLLGVLCGPHFTGLLTQQLLASFDTLTIVALAWLALIIGAQYGLVREVAVPRARMLAGIGLAAATLLFVAAIVAVTALVTTDLAPKGVAALALGVGAVSTETTRHAVRWVAERYSATGPVATLLIDVWEADDAIPLLTLAVLFALVPGQGTVHVPWPAGGAVVANLGIGAAIGATCAALFDIEPRNSQRWGILLGTTLLAVGASMRLGLAPVATAFVMGYGAASLSKERRELRELVSSTERAVMLPALVLAGAHVTFPSLGLLAPILVAALLSRFVAKIASARALAKAARVPRAVTPTLGVGLMPAGALSMTAGFACALRFPGFIGSAVLTIAIVNVVLGEIVGPAMLRRALKRVGEVSDAATSTPRSCRKESPQNATENA
ncbi:MAG: potassium transporter Kef [Polyangiaceae bacterium]